MCVRVYVPVTSYCLLSQERQLVCRVQCTFTPLICTRQSVLFPLEMYAYNN